MKTLTLGRTRLVINLHGDASGLLDDIIGFLNEVYGKVDYEGVVHVKIFDRIGDMEDAVYVKALHYGVSAIGFGMLSYYEAWSGIPTIYTSTQIAEKYGVDMLRAVIHHESGHSVLHPSPLYYIPPVVDVNMKPDDAYVAFMGVKDYEVSKLLVNLELGRFQEPLVKLLVKDSSYGFSDFKVFLQLLPLEEVLNLGDVLKELALKLGFTGRDVSNIRDILEEQADTFSRYRVLVKYISGKMV